jgi:hypothetical protein
VMLPAAVRGLFLAGAMLVVCESFAAPAIEIPWKIDEPTAQRLAAEAHYGADKYLDAFDDDSNLSPPFLCSTALTSHRPKVVSVTLPSTRGRAMCGRSGDAANYPRRRCADRKQRFGSASLVKS